MEKITIGISSCLLGNKVRYDGGHASDQYITQTLGEYFQWIPVCPEVEYGLPVPREAMRLTGSVDHPRLMTIRTRQDHTERMLSWAEKKNGELALQGLCGFIFKSKSPSSGIAGIKVYGDSGVPRKQGVGIFGGAFMRRFPLIPVIDDGRLHDPALRENFIERVFVYQRWQDFIHMPVSLKDLISFHTRHKYLIMAHNPRHYGLLGKMVAHASRDTLEPLLAEYVRLLMEQFFLDPHPIELMLRNHA